jgi:hypothetical protein
VDTKHQRAWRSARRWTLSRKEIAFPLVAGVATLIVALATGSPLPALITLGGIAAAALFVPIAVYVGSYLTAGGNIIREELAFLRSHSEQSSADDSKRVEEEEREQRIRDVLAEHLISGDYLYSQIQKPDLNRMVS